MVSMKYILYPLLACTSLLSVSYANAQGSNKSDNAVLRQKEDSLREVAARIVMAREPADRFRADSLFTRMRVRALKIPYSFNYPFDAIIHISKLY